MTDIVAKVTPKIQKPVNVVTVLVFQDEGVEAPRIEVRHSSTDLNDVRDLLETGREIITRKGLSLASAQKKPDIMHADTMPGLRTVRPS